MDDYRVKEPYLPAVPPAAEPDEPAPIVVPVSRLLDLRRPTWVLVLMLAWPTLVQQLLVFAVNLFDGLMAGRFQNLAGQEQIATQAAQTTANYLAWFLSSCTILVSVGATALVARLLGGGDRRGAVHACNQALLLGVLLGCAAARRAISACRTSWKPCSCMAKRPSSPLLSSGRCSCC